MNLVEDQHAALSSAAQNNQGNDSLKSMSDHTANTQDAEYKDDKVETGKTINV